MSPARLALFLALRQLKDRKMLNGIAVSGVALGVVVLVVMSNITRDGIVRFEREIVRVSPHVTIYDRDLGSSQRMADRYVTGPLVAQVSHDQPTQRTRRIERPRELVHALEAMSGVEAACMVVGGQAVLSFGGKEIATDLRGVLPTQEERCTPMSVYVKEGSWEALATDADGLALGATLARDIGAHIGDHVHLVAAGGSGQAFKIVAIFETRVLPIDRRRLFTNLAAGQSLLGRPDAISAIEVRLSDTSTDARFATRFERLTGHDAEGWREANANYVSIMNLQTLVVQMIIGAIMLVGGFGILAVQIMLVLQKTRDISILRSIGLRRADILMCFLTQGTVVAVLGAALGDLLAWRLVDFLLHLEVDSGGLVAASTFISVTSPEYYAWGALFALVTGTIASVVPAWRASRVEPVDVLRGQIG